MMEVEKGVSESSIVGCCSSDGRGKKGWGVRKLADLLHEKTRLECMLKSAG